MDLGQRPGSDCDLTSQQFLVSPVQPVPLQARKPLDPEDSVELINLMLVANRQQTVGFLDLLGTVEILIIYADAGMAFDVLRDTGH